jgi:putative ABC transport system ATP-binding protein
MVRLDGVVKSYRQGARAVRALDGVTLAVGRGEFVAVMGPSGSGKSTLLHLIGGLDPPTSGEVWVNERALSTMSDDDVTIFRRRHVGFVFQFFNLLPTMTAEENVAYPLLLDGLARGEAMTRAARELARVGLADRRTHRPDALSGGEAQRVAVARALVGEPLLLLADEPTGNLDSRTGDEVLGLIRDACRALGTTVVMVTHDARAAAVAGRTITLVDGRVVAGAGRLAGPTPAADSGRG